MRLLICSTGTSIANGVVPLDKQPNSEQFRQDIRARINKMRENDTPLADLLKAAAAETNSLNALKLNDDDRLVLMHTETPDGQICAEELARLLETTTGLRAELRVVSGLQVNDAKRFRGTGIQSLFSELDRLCRPERYDSRNEVILNATGGFKSVVPYFTLYGLLNRLPVVYIFERSNALITLPPAPVHFDYERLSQAIDAITQLQQQGAMKAEDFYRAIPGLDYHDRDWYDSLLESDGGGYVTLSAFGVLMTNALADEQSQVLLSPQASDQYQKSSGYVRSQFNFMLERVKNPLWRQGKMHPFAGTDLLVFKPGNTGERMACIVRGSRMFVCELLRHDEYVRVLPGKKAAQYDTDRFAPWVLPPTEPIPPATEERAFAELQERLEETDSCWQTAEKGLSNVKSEITRIQAQLKEKDIVHGELTSSLARCKESEAAWISSAQEISTLRKQLALARRPWWKKLFRIESD